MPLGDVDTDRPQQRQQPRHRDLSLMVEGEHEAAQLRPVMSAEAGRQRRGQHFAVRLLPALALEIHHQRTDHQVLHDETCVALEACIVQRSRDLDDTHFVDRKLRCLAALRSRLACSRRRRLRIGRLVHPAGFAGLDVRPARAALQSRDLVALRRNRSPKFRRLFQQLQHQDLQISGRKAVKVCGRRHSHSKSNSRCLTSP